MTSDGVVDRRDGALPGTVGVADGEPRPVATDRLAAASSRRRSALGLALLVTVVIAVHSPMLAIHPWGDDFENYSFTAVDQRPVAVSGPLPAKDS